jgi:hypothetical protein
VAASIVMPRRLSIAALRSLSHGALLSYRS